jgi:hypothetical protein
MQKASLPALPPVVQGLDSAFLTRFAGEVGGDFLLFVAPEAESKTEPLLGITIGDITGKGIPAALGAIGIAHLLPWLRPLDDPCRALHDLNVDLCERLPEAYSRLCPLWRSAGRPCASGLQGIRRPALEREGETCHRPGRHPWTRRSGYFPTGRRACGDRVGHWRRPPPVYRWCDETRNARGEQFTVDGIIKSLSRCGGASAAEIVQTLRQDVEAWGTPVDDMTLVVCRRVPDAWNGNVGSRTNDDAM